MYGHAGRKNVYGKEIKLVRVRAFDSRVQENSVRRGGGLQGKTVKRGDGRVNVRAVKSGGGRMYARTAKSGGGRMYARTAKSGDGRVHGRAVE